VANKVAVQLLIGQNEEPFLEAALRSVAWVDYVTCCNTDLNSYWGKINQKIVEDVTNDLGLELRMSYVFPEVTCAFSFAEARNSCLAHTGEDDYVFIVDSDDVHYPEWEHKVH